MKKINVLVLSLILLMGCFCSCSQLEAKKVPVATENATKLTVATFNLRMDTPNDGLDAWPNRKEMAKNLIAYHDFDIFGVQEAFLHMIKGITELPNYDYLGVGREDGKEKGEYAAIIYRKDKFKVLNHGNFWLSKTPEKVSFGWDAVCIRICTWGEFEDLASGDTFYFFNVHFDHKGVIARRESAKLMIRKIKEIAGDQKVICTGDFNGVPTCEPIQIMLNSKFLLDSKAVSEKTPYGTEGTFTSFDVKSEAKDRIDFLFVTKDIKVKSYATLNEVIAGHFPSDHFPVMIKVEF